MQTLLNIVSRILHEQVWAADNIRDISISYLDPSAARWLYLEKGCSMCLYWIVLSLVKCALPRLKRILPGYIPKTEKTPGKRLPKCCTDSVRNAHISTYSTFVHVHW
jgi:hypothetical protein